MNDSLFYLMNAITFYRDNFNNYPKYDIFHVLIKLKKSYKANKTLEKLILMKFARVP